MIEVLLRPAISADRVSVNTLLCSVNLLCSYVTLFSPFPFICLSIHIWYRNSSSLVSNIFDRWNLCFKRNYKLLFFTVLSIIYRNKKLFHFVITYTNGGLFSLKKKTNQVI